MDQERTNAPTGQERIRLEEMRRMFQHNFDQAGDHPTVTIQLSQTDCGKSAELEKVRKLAFSASTEFRKISEQKKRSIFVKSVLIMLVVSALFATATHFVLCYFS